MTMLVRLPPQALLEDILLRCLPARPACQHIPRIVMQLAAQPVPLTETDSKAVRAVEAVAEWCCGDWLAAGHCRDAAATLTTALRHCCEPPPRYHMPLLNRCRRGTGAPCIACIGRLLACTFSQLELLGMTPSQH
jgi:hypothetical protein